jgi:hypothetical protein
MKRTFAAAIIALLTVTTPARAAIIQWNLLNVSSTDFPSITFTGFFDYDTVANAAPGPIPTLPSWKVAVGASPDFSITMFNGGSPEFTWSPSNSFGLFSDTPGATPIFQTGTGSPLDPLTLINLVPGIISFNGAVSPIALLGPWCSPGCDGSGFYLDGGLFSAGLQGSITTAEVSAVPLPPALPLFGWGVLALAGLAWRSRGKVS